MRLWPTVVFFAIALAVAMARWVPPAATDGPPETFSASRAGVVEDAIARTGPRPMGSPNAKKARDFLREHLVRNGYNTTIERAFACRRSNCGFVENVVGRRGVEGRPAVLLSAHYDSVAGGPGAADDGLGVAAVAEAARALSLGDAGRPIMVLFSDGEEAGLLGAEAFTKRHSGEIFAVINCDARGTSGPSMMFETSGDTGWIISTFAAVSARPMTSSLFYEAYERLPNDTDFTRLKTLAPGINLANTSGVTRYHTALDSIENADPRTLQHHGDQVLAMARAFAKAPSPLPSDASTWFDVLGAFVVRWPSNRTTLISGAAFALLLGQAIRKRAFGRGLLAAPAAFLAAICVAFAMGVLLKLGGVLPVPWVAHPAPAVASLYCASLTAGSAAAALFRKTEEAERWAGTWLLFGSIGVGAAVLAPGASYLFAMPALAAGLAGFLGPTPAAVFPAMTAAVLWMSLAVPLYDAVGLLVPVAVCIPAIVLVCTLAPLVHEATWITMLVAATLSVTLALAATRMPIFTPEVPQRVNVTVVQDGAASEIAVSTKWGSLEWGASPPAMLAAMGATRTGRVLPWHGESAIAPIALPRLPAPVVSELVVTVDQNRRRARGTVRSQRGASTFFVSTGTRAIRITAEGMAMQTGLLVLKSIPDQGITIDFDAEGTEPIVLVVRDSTPGAAPSVVSKRPANAASSQDGDTTVVVSEVRL